MNLLSVVIPCYNEEDVLNEFYKELKKTLNLITYSSEIIFIDDGSTDNTLKVIKKISEDQNNIHYIALSRNYGKEAAIYAGLKNSKGNLVVLMDADLQDPPSLLPEMIEYIESGDYDSVATRRVSREGEPKIRSFFARQFYKLINKISRADVVDGARDYRLMTRQFVDSIISLGEYNRFSKGLFGWIGFKTKWLEYKNVQRFAGETKWSFWSLFIYAIDGVIGFSTLPLHFASILGILFSLVSLVSILLIIIRTLIYGDPVAGYPSMLSVILLMGGLILSSIGVLGQYLAKTYLETKKRPIYIEKENTTN